jgi:hypothetical protein
VFKEKCLPDNKYEMPETVDTKLEKLDMCDEMYVHVGKEEQTLSNSTYPHPRRGIYGTVHSEKFQVDGCSVGNLYQYPTNNRITKSNCVPMPNYIYDFTKIIWERTRDLMPSAARYIPPYHCSQHFYYRKFKGGLNKHRDVCVGGGAHNSCLVR